LDKIGLLLIVLAIAYWLLNYHLAQTVIVAVTIGVIWGVIWLVIYQYKRHEAREATRRQHEAEQGSMHSQLVTLTSTSLTTFEAMPTQLLSAEGALDRAETDFADGAFAPFWDSVENAATCIGRFDDGIRTITLSAKQHLEVTKTYEARPPQFPISSSSVRGMVVANTTTDRMRAIVRKAQCNFQFATIYEQRKTNKLLVAGFQNLAQVIDGLGDRITSSIDGLGNQISEMSSSLSHSLSELNDQSSERHKDALEILDNIQRRRVPYPRKFGDGAY
jgi:hypothetical protein